MKRIASLLACSVLLAPAAVAHDGPPYPIFVDEAFDGSTVSIWADPDVGTGTFFVYLDRPLNTELRIGARPIDGRLDEAFVVAEPADEDEPFDLVGKVPFDRRGMWQVRFLAGEGEPDELSIPVDVTPPGLGTLDLLWYASPFLAIAFLWIKVAVQRRRLGRSDRRGSAAPALVERST